MNGDILTIVETIDNYTTIDPLKQESVFNVTDFCATIELGRVNTRNFTRRANRSRTIRVGLPVYTLRPLRRVRPVH